jgi:hypothetical protein
MGRTGTGGCAEAAIRILELQGVVQIETLETEVGVDALSERILRSS